MHRFLSGCQRLLVSRALLLGLLIGSSPFAFGQQYSFLPVTGSPKAGANLFQDSRGRLWLGGTKSACFDGTRFFLLSDYGLPPVRVSDFSEDPGGAIWIATEVGIYRFANGRMEQLSKSAARNVIAVTSEVAVVLGGGVTGAPLVRIQRAGDRWKTETVMDLDASGPLTLDPSGMLLYPWPGKGWSEMRLEDVVRWQPGRQVAVIRHPVSGFPGTVDLKVLRDPSGCVWWSGGDVEDFYDCGQGPHAAPFKGANLRSFMREGRDGSMVLLGDDLLAVGRPGSFRVATHANGMPAAVDAVQGRDGTVWLSTVQGLFRFASPFRIEQWSIRDGLTSTPWSIARSGGRIYAGLYKRIEVLKEDRSRWETVATFDDGTLVAGLIGDAHGGLVAAIKDGGVVQVSASGSVIARTGKNRPGGAMRLARTPEGDIWLGQTRFGRLIREASALNVEDHPLQTQPSQAVHAIKYVQQTRKLWACYNGGLVERDEHGIWREFTTRDGLLHNGCWSLAPLSNGDVWYSYFEQGVLALIRPLPSGGLNVRNYGTSDGIPEPGGITLDTDQRGWLWRGGGLGVYVADQTEAEAGKWLQLDQSDGFISPGMNSGSVFVDQDGSLWWGADNDLVHYAPPPDLVTPPFSPQIHVSAFSWDGQAPRLAETVADVPHGVKLVAHIGSLQFDRRNALRLRYRLLPEQPAWRESSSLDLSLGSLSWGAHTLEVQARIFTGPWSPTVGRSLTILRPVWLTWPLLLLYAMTTALLTVGGIVVRRRRQAEQAVLLPDLAAWRLGALLPEVDELSGTLLDSRFEVGELLARGGFANVMLGYDRDQKQRCAVKVFRSEVKDTAWIQRRFEHEVAALKKVSHPNVVSIYAHGSTPSGAPYLVMEFVEGQNLREMLGAGAIAAVRAAKLLRQLATALDAIHAHDIWHRDVKPENVIIRKEGSPEEEAVLIDFSIAIVKDANETLYGLSRAAGSFDYMAPEQVIGYADASSDVYSLAKLAIEMLAGNRLSRLLPEASIDLPSRVRELLKGLDVPLSPETIDTLARALEFDPSKRPRRAGSLVDPLADDLESGARSR